MANSESIEYTKFRYMLTAFIYVFLTTFAVAGISKNEIQIFPTIADHTGKISLILGFLASVAAYFAANYDPYVEQEHAKFTSGHLVGVILRNISILLLCVGFSIVGIISIYLNWETLMS